MDITSNSPLVKNLIEYGLSDKEAKTYLALLKLEVATVNEIAQVTGINRSSAYVVLGALKEKGLVNISIDKKIQRYVATTPEALLQVAENKARRQREIKEKIDAIVPELKALHKDTKKRPKVLVYEGMNGLANAFGDSLSCREKMVRVFSAAQNLSEPIINYFHKRNELKIAVKGIHPNTDNSKKLIKLSPEFDDSVLIPKDQYCFSADLAIYDNKIGYMSSGNGGWAIIIESKEMSEIMKSVFDLAFSRAKEIGICSNQIKKASI